MAELHHLTSFQKSRKNPKRIGRGLGSGHGAYSTRGVKGQRARSGGSHGLKTRGMKQIILRIPKLGGFRSIHAKGVSVNLSRLNEQFNGGETVNPRILVRKGIIKSSKGKKIVDVKILGEGTLTKPLIFKDCSVSKAAKEKIEKAGGTISITL